MKLSQDILFYIGQNYLKTALCIKKMFYHNKDDELQLILYGEVLHKYKLFSKTTLPLSYIYFKNENHWIHKKMAKIYISILHLLNHGFESIQTLHKSEELYEKTLEYYDKNLYEIYITFQTKEKTKKKLIIKIEYINRESNVSVFNFTLTKDSPFNLEEIKHLIYKRVIN